MIERCGMVLRGLGRDLAAPLELGDQRVVARELLELTLPHAVGAAVAHVRQAHLVAVDLGERERGAHARRDSSATARS